MGRFYGTYSRLNLPVWATNLEVIRAGRRKLKRSARTSRKVRDARHEFFRDLIACHKAAQDIYTAVQSGDIKL